MVKFKALRDFWFKISPNFTSLFSTRFSQDSKETNRILIAAILSIFISGLAYQNCSNPAVPSNSTLASQAVNTDFPYDSQIDQIAYMSCNQMNPGDYDNSAYFTFRPGAYRTGTGVEVTTAFRNSPFVLGGAATDQASFLAAIPAVVSARPQLAVRSFSNFQSVLMQTAGSSGTDGLDYTTFLLSMDDPNFALAVINSALGDGVKYVRTEAVAGARFEASIYLNNTYPNILALETGLNNQTYFLTLTYQGGSGSYSARGPADYGISSTSNAISAYGRGYELTFRQPTGASSTYRSSVLGSVSELNLENRTPPSIVGNWTCNPNMQFRVLRTNLTEELALAGCVKTVDNPTDANLAIVRNSFRVEDWYVDMANRCLIPKKAGAGCYAASVGTSLNTPLTNGVYSNDWIDYNLADPAYAPGLNKNIWVEMASICYR